MIRKMICSCGKLIADNEICPCKKKARAIRNKQKNELNAELSKVMKSVKWKRFRKNIINRDGAACQRCLIKYNIINSDNLQVHHIKPRSEYPELTFEPENCITLCKTCNLQLGTKDELDFKTTIETLDDFVI